MDYALVRNIVYSAYPRHLSTDIPIDTKLQVVLRYDLDSIGFKKENVILQNVDMAHIVPIEVEYKNRRINVTPVQELEQNCHYILEIVGGNEGIKTITDQVLEESWILEFYTGTSNEMKPPIITSPTNQTTYEGKVTFKWEESEGVFYNHLQISESNTFNHIVWPPEPDINVYEGEATPNYAYENKRYYARIKAVSLDKKESAWSETIQFYIETEEHIDTIDNQMQDPSYLLESNIKTENNEISVIQDSITEEGQLEAKTNIEVKGVSVLHGEVNVAMEYLKEFHIEFAEPIDPSSINSRTIYLVGERN